MGAEPSSTTSSCVDEELVETDEVEDDGDVVEGCEDELVTGGAELEDDVVRGAVVVVVDDFGSER